MTEAEAIEAICVRWKASWEASQPTVPYALPNESFRSQDATRYAEVSFGPIQSRQITQGPIGGRRFERRGIVNVKLATELDAGENPIALLAGSVRTALEAQQIGGSSTVEPVQTFSASSQRAKQGGWWTEVVSVPFVFWETA